MASITVKSNLEDGKKTAERLSDEIPESADDAATIIANSWQREAQRVMQRNGSVVTGTGLRSLKLQDLGKGKAGVTGASYLEDLDTGTGPHHPDTNNQRFIAAARSYGMSRQALAQTIARQGTQPHPWIAETTAKIRKSAPKRVQIELDKAVSKSISQFT